VLRRARRWGASVYLPLIWEIQNAGVGRRAVLLRWLIRASVRGWSSDRQIANQLSNLNSIRTRRGLGLEVGISNPPLEVKRKRFSPMGSRSVDLATRHGAVFAPPVRARSAARASPRLLGLLGIASAACPAACVGAPLDLACVPQLPACTSGASVPTRGTSHWGYPLRVERHVPSHRTTDAERKHGRRASHLMKARPEDHTRRLQLHSSFTATT
jgi:hypothetical protein